MMTTRATCPYCGKRVALTKTGKLHAHNDPETRRPCVRAPLDQLMRSADRAIVYGIRHPQRGRADGWNKLVRAQLAGDADTVNAALRAGAAPEVTGPLTRAPVVVADNVHGWASERQSTLDGFPCLLPPWPKAWIEYPNDTGRQRRAAWCVDVSWMLDHYDDLAKRAQLPPGPWTEMLAGCIEDARVNFPDRKVGRLLGLQMYVDDSKAGVMGGGPTSPVYGPVGALMFALDDLGAFLGNRWLLTVTGLGDIPGDQVQNGDREVAQTLLLMANTALWTISLCHARNAVWQYESSPSKVARKFAARHGRQPSRYQVLKMVLPRRASRGGHGTGDVGSAAVHPVSGHLAHYGDCCPSVHEPNGKLFGRLTGIYWVPFHLRGSADAGEVDTDYEPKLNV